MPTREAPATAVAVAKTLSSLRASQSVIGLALSIGVSADDPRRVRGLGPRKVGLDRGLAIDR